MKRRHHVAAVTIVAAAATYRLWVLSGIQGIRFRKGVGSYSVIVFREYDGDVYHIIPWNLPRKWPIHKSTLRRAD